MSLRARFFTPERLTSLMHLTAVGIILVSMVSHLMSEHIFVFQIFSHFQLQYVAALAILVALLISVRQFFLGILSLLYIILISVFFLYPFEISPGKPQEVDVFFMNVYGKKHVNMRPIVKEIEKHSPPVVALVEANEDIITPLRKIYGEPHITEKNGHFHCAVFSREIVITTQAIGGLHTPVCLVEFEDYQLMVVHTFSPLIPSAWKKNKHDLYQISNHIDNLSQQNKPFLVVGDFNSSPYAYPFRRVIGPYVDKHVYTWQTGSIQMLPLDYALSDMDIIYHRTIRLTSDHAGLLIDLPE